MKNIIEENQNKFGHLVDEIYANFLRYKINSTCQINYEKQEIHLTINGIDERTFFQLKITLEGYYLIRVSNDMFAKMSEKYKDLFNYFYDKHMNNYIKIDDESTHKFKMLLSMIVDFNNEING